MQTPDGFLCDRCGYDVSPGSIILCLIVSDVVNGRVVNRHFCRDESNGRDSCAKILLENNTDFADAEATLEG